MQQSSAGHLRLLARSTPGRGMARLLFVAAAILLASSAFGQSMFGHKNPSTNTFLRRTNTTSSVVVSMSGTVVAAPSDTFTLQKQVFTGSTTCAAGGGPILFVTGLSSSVTDTTSLTSIDSVALTAFPFSDKNGTFSGFQNPNAATISFPGGSTWCVQGPVSGSVSIPAQYGPAVQVMDSSCSRPKFLFNSGDMVCVAAAGTGGTGGSPWHVVLQGGTPNPCTTYSFPVTNITGESGTATFTLPANNSAIPAGCSAGSSTTDIRGNWTATLQNNSNSGVTSDTFRVHDSNPFYDLSLTDNGQSDLNGQGGLSNKGYIKYPVTVQNNGPDAAPNVSLVQHVPAGLSVFQAMAQTSGPAFNCGPLSGGAFTCTIASFPPDQFANFTMVVFYDQTATCASTNPPGPFPPCTAIPNSATISSGGTDYTSINNSVDQTVTPSSNSYVGNFICPADITMASTSSSGANVTYANLSTTSTYNDTPFHNGPASGALFPIGITQVGWQADLGSGSCFFHVTVNDGQNPELSIVKTHNGFFPRGSKNLTYTMTVENVGGLSTSGTVNVSDVPPIGLLPTSMSGPGWTCSSLLVCSRSDTLTSAMFYPPLTLTFNLPQYTACCSNTNKAFVRGGGAVFIKGPNDSPQAGPAESDDLGIVINPVGHCFARGDFQGDCKGDLLWHNSSTGDNSVWLMNGANLAVQGALPSVANTAWQIAGIGDFNGDGFADVLWHNTSTGDNSVWFMSGPNVAVSGTLPSVPNTNWVVAGVGDFQGDGKADILWHNTVTGNNSIWLMNGTNIAAQGSLPTIANTAWVVAGVGDFNGDGKDDILWHNTSTGDNSVWLMNGINVAVSAALPSVSNTAWQIAGVGDLNGDGFADIVWRNVATGNNSVWFMSGINVAVSASLPTVGDTNWRIARISDFQGDGKADLMWHNISTGNNSIWLMNGANVAVSGSLPTIANTAWGVGGPP